MIPWAYITLAGVIATCVLVGTGWWRRAFIVFAIRPSRMTVEKLGLMVSSRDNVVRVNTILESFAGGFNTMIAKPSATACRTYCDSRPPLYRPFAEEGLAMGYTLRQLFRYDPARFEERIVRPRPEYRYLYYVGLGFWSGMRKHTPQRLARIVDGLDPLHRYLCYDGYGFKHAFFDYREDPNGLRRLELLDGYARNTAYQGVGRAFWFLFRDRPEVLIEHAARLGDCAPDVAAGVGLACAFVNPDRLEVARELAAKMPANWHDHFHLGMCFALKARAINDIDRFQHDMSLLEPQVEEAVHASIRECDRIELQVRAEAAEDGYRRWRSRVTQWMAEHIDYPLVKVRTSAATTHSQPTAST